MKRSFEKLLDAIRTAGEADTCPVNAQRMIRLAKEELKLNEQGFSPAQLETLDAAIKHSVKEAGASFAKKCA